MQNYGNNKCRILNFKFAMYIINVFIFLVLLKLKRKELGKAAQRRKSMRKKIGSVGAKLGGNDACSQWFNREEIGKEITLIQIR
jgi:hypothetical protein